MKTDIMPLINEAQKHIETLSHVKESIQRSIDSLEDVLSDLPDQIELETVIEDLQAAYIDMTIAL